jgi:molybdopterin molybdotransferase
LANVPARLEVIGEIKAGAAPESQARTVGPGQAIGIMTGAPLPEGSDAVVMVEHTSSADDSAEIEMIEVTRSINAGYNFVPRGAEARAGQILLDRGHRLDPAGIAIAASVGKARVQVYSKPRVAILSTGDELVETDISPGPNQIRNSNSYSLAAQVQNAGGEPVRLPIAPDEPMRLQALIDEGLGCDLLLLTGGVSMGKYDLVEQVLTGLQGEFYFTGVNIQPGKPVVFGSCGAGALARLLAAHEKPTGTGMPAPQKKYFFGLPGNPVSTMVTFELFAKPMLEALSGLTPQPLIFLSARLKSEIRTKTGLKRFLPAILSGEFETAEVEPAPWQGSGDIAALAKANCYVVIPPDRERIEAGEWVSLLMR